MPETLSKLHCDNYFSPAAYQEVHHMIENIKETLRSKIKDLHWMSSKIKDKALVKLNHLKVHIGCPETFQLEEVKFAPSSSFADNLLALRCAKNALFMHGLASMDISRLGFTSFTLDAMYRVVSNDVVIPLGIIQSPVFELLGDVAENYGGLGYIISHEINHAFDFEGVYYDEHGRYNPWLGDDAEKYSAIKDEVIAQFSDYRVLGQRVNGRATMNENVADIGGLYLAYHALQLAYSKTQREPIKQAFTPEQRFFIAFAQWFAANTKDVIKRYMLKSDDHAPNEIRAKCVPQNLVEFARAFNGDYSSDKCIRPWDKSTNPVDYAEDMHKLRAAEQLALAGMPHEALEKVESCKVKWDPTCFSLRNNFRDAILLRQVDNYEAAEQDALNFLNKHEEDFRSSKHVASIPLRRQCFQQAVKAAKLRDMNNYAAAIKLLAVPHLEKINCVDDFLRKLRAAEVKRNEAAILWPTFVHNLEAFHARLSVVEAESEKLHELKKMSSSFTSFEKCFENTEYWSEFNNGRKKIKAIEASLQLQKAASADQFSVQLTLLDAFIKEEFGIFLSKVSQKLLGGIFENFARHLIGTSSFSDALRALNVPYLLYKEQWVSFRPVLREQIATTEWEQLAKRLDNLSAYEQYEEASKLLEQKRDTFHGTSCWSAYVARLKTLEDEASIEHKKPAAKRRKFN